MTLVVLDTETTGLDFKEGHRVIELGCVVLKNRKHTEQRFHSYLNPQRSVDAAAQEVHGITDAFLEDKPVFGDVFEAFLEFISGAELVIHNAPFDLGFLNHELELAGDSRRLQELCRVTDTLKLARELHPGQRNSLDALCRRYGVDNSGRALHGALLDAEILADVYLAMTGGQTALRLDAPMSYTGATTESERHQSAPNDNFKIIRASDEELTAHQSWVKLLGEHSAWGPLDSSGSD